MGELSTLGAPAGRVAGAAGCHLYGVVPAGARVPAGGAALVPYQRIAALVGDLPAEPAHTRRRLLAHAEVLDRTAAVAPVLPMRYGVVLPSAEAVRREVLAPNHDAFAAALARLSGRAQYTVRARYAADEPLREVLATEPLVRDLHQRLHRPAGGPDHAGRMRLGELVARSVAARRERDTAALVDLLRPYAEAAVARISRALEGERVADASFLVDLGCSGEFESAVEDLGRRWRERIRLRLLGPMAAYHFVDELVAGGDGG